MLQRILQTSFAFGGKAGETGIPSKSIEVTSVETRLFFKRLPKKYRQD
jgi:hypothetical protein